MSANIKECSLCFPYNYTLMVQLMILWAHSITLLGTHLELFPYKTYWSIKDILLENMQLTELAIFSMLINICFPLTLWICVCTLQIKKKGQLAFDLSQKNKSSGCQKYSKGIFKLFKRTISYSRFWWVIHIFKLSNKNPSSLQQEVFELLAEISH